MPKRRRYEWTEKKIERYIKAGRGSGTGKAYKPWLTTHDLASIGRSQRILGITTGRIHYVFSDIERRVLYVYDFSDRVADIREQFSLSREQTIRIAQQAGIRHPRDFKNKIPIVMTTDFLIKVIVDDKYRYIARAVKQSSELRKKRTIEKLTIERLYWESNAVDWGIITEKEIPRALSDNIEWVHPYYDIEYVTEPQEGFHTQAIDKILSHFPTEKDTALNYFSQELDDKYLWPQGTCLKLMRHLLARKILIMDFGSRLAVHAPVHTMKRKA